MSEASEPLALGTLLLGLFGGLALFLYGIDQMSEGLKAVAGNRMSSLLGGVTRNRFLGALTGALVTAVLNSSSVTTVLVVGFITAGIMTLPQSIGVIMGANIGSTMTAQVVAFKITEYAMLPVAVGFAMIFLAKTHKTKHIGSMLFGLGLLFWGMGVMSDAMYPLRSYPPFLDLMARMENPLLGILVGTVFTALVQSSAATTGIAIVMASEGLMSLPAGIALALGANIGTCATAILAALGKPAAARRAAAAHILFNVIGVVIWLPFIGMLAGLATSISPAHLELEGSARMAAEVPRQIANAHTIFNVVNTALFIWFTQPLAALVRKLVPERAEPVPERAQPIYLDEVYFETPDIALDRVRLELVRLGEGVQEMLEAAPAAVRNGSREDLDALVAHNDDSTRLYEAIVGYLSRLAREELDSARTAQLSALSGVANTIDNMGDTVATNLVWLGQERLEAQIEPSEATTEAFRPLVDTVREAFAGAIAAVRDRNVGAAGEVIAMKGRVQSLAHDVNAHLGGRIVEAGVERMTAYRIESDAVEIMQRLYYFAKRVAKAVVDVAKAEDGQQEMAA